MFGVYIYMDMHNGETLQHYFRFVEKEALVFGVFLPIVNTIVIIWLLIEKLLKKLWNKIKYWKK